MPFSAAAVSPPFFTGDGPDFPRHDLISMDDAQIMAIMVRMGENSLSGPVPWEKYGPGTRQPIRIVIRSEHATHWLMFMRFEGGANPADNGYVLHGFLKGAQTEEQMLGRVRDVLAHHKFNLSFTELRALAHQS